MTLTAARLRELAHYDPSSGVFTRLVASGYRGRHPAGRIMRGELRNGRHIAIGIDGGRYYAHRLAVLYMTGAWPVGVVDHKDGDGQNNRWANLRDVTQQVNMQNLQSPPASNTGVRNVSFDAARGKFAVGLRRVDGSRVRGRFDTLAEAAAFAAAAKQVEHGGLVR